MLDRPLLDAIAPRARSGGKSMCLRTSRPRAGRLAVNDEISRIANELADRARKYYEQQGWL
jgi:hypothetical protein